MKFQVRYKFKVNGVIREGLETEASWYYIDQRGKFYSSGPMRPIEPCDDDYEMLEPLIKINNEYLSVEEIEKRLKKVEKLEEKIISLSPCKCGSKKYGIYHRPEDHTGWKPE